MNMKLELVPVPVTDVDRAKSFYTDKAGFGVDVDVRPSENVRIVQLTRPAQLAPSSSAPAFPRSPTWLPAASKASTLSSPTSKRLVASSSTEAWRSRPSTMSAAASSTPDSPTQTATR